MRKSKSRLGDPRSRNKMQQALISRDESTNAFRFPEPSSWLFFNFQVRVVEGKVEGAWSWWVGAYALDTRKIYREYRW